MVFMFTLPNYVWNLATFKPLFTNRGPKQTCLMITIAETEFLSTSSPQSVTVLSM